MWSRHLVTAVPGGEFGPGNFALKIAKCIACKCDDFMVAA